MRHADYRTGERVKMFQSTIAGYIGCSRKTVNRAVGNLRRLGWIELTDTRQGNRKHWRLTIPEAEPDSEVWVSWEPGPNEDPPF